MKYSEGIDFAYLLQRHGWSNVYIFVDGAVYQLSPTHIFDDPIDVMLNGLICMLRGDNEVCFTWHDEPGEHLWKLERNQDQHHKVRVSITNCYQVGSRDSGKSFVDLGFEVKFKLFCICILKQMQKVRALMSEKSFSENRGSFPHSTFEEFLTLFGQAYLSQSDQVATD